MNKIMLSPSSAVWQNEQGWHAQITIWINDEPPLKAISLRKDFTEEYAAMAWRGTLTMMLRDFSIETDPSIYANLPY